MPLVYLVTNKVNGKQYVGYTASSLAKRRSGHTGCAPALKCRKFHAALMCHGRHQFVWQVLSTGERAEMLRAEQEYIAQLDTIEQGYNISPGGEGAPHSEETKARIRAANKGKPSPLKGVPRSEETRAVMRAAQKGLRKSPEARSRMSAAKKGKAPPETQRLASVATKRAGRDPNLARHVRKLLQDLSIRDVVELCGVSATVVRNIKHRKHGW